MVDDDKALSNFERVIGFCLRLLIIFLILGAAFFVARYWLKNRPTAQRRPPVRQARFVQARTLRPQPRSVIVNAMGEVIPAQESRVAAEVSGRIIELDSNLVPGGRFAAGAVLARIDRIDYELALKRAEANLQMALAELAREMGQQAVARRELEMLDKEKSMIAEDRALVLRNPQLRIAKATVAAAESAVDSARVSLERTSVRAPFDCVVKARMIERGERVNAGAVVAELVATDAYWVEVSVPVDELHWIDIPEINAETGSTAKIFHTPAWGDGVQRRATVYRLLPDLEQAGRMARVLIKLSDPLDLGTTKAAERRPLTLGAYVRAEIIGQTVPKVVAVERENIHNGNQVWLVADDGTLQIQDVRIIWSDQDNVYVNGGLDPGDVLVTSDIATPVSGMKLRTE